MDKLNENRFYQSSLQLWDEFWNDSEILMKDVRGVEIARQLTRSVGSISANIEEGYGHGNGKEYPHFLKISRGSARETKGWYLRSKFLLNREVIEKRIELLDKIIGALVKSIATIESKNKGK